MHTSTVIITAILTVNVCAMMGYKQLVIVPEKQMKREAKADAKAKAKAQARAEAKAEAETKAKAIKAEAESKARAIKAEAETKAKAIKAIQEQEKLESQALSEFLKSEKDAACMYLEQEGLVKNAADNLSQIEDAKQLAVNGQIPLRFRESDDAVVYKDPKTDKRRRWTEEELKEYSARTYMNWKQNPCHPDSIQFVLWEVVSRLRSAFEWANEEHFQCIIYQRTNTISIYVARPVDCIALTHQLYLKLYGYIGPHRYDCTQAIKSSTKPGDCLEDRTYVRPEGDEIKFERLKKIPSVCNLESHHLVSWQIGVQTSPGTPAKYQIHDPANWEPPVIPIMYASAARLKFLQEKILKYMLHITKETAFGLKLLLLERFKWIPKYNTLFIGLRLSPRAAALTERKIDQTVETETARISTQVFELLFPSTGHHKIVVQTGDVCFTTYKKADEICTDRHRELTDVELQIIHNVNSEFEVIEKKWLHKGHNYLRIGR